MKKFRNILIVFLITMIALAACGNNDNGTDTNEGTKEKLNVITSFTLIEDIINQVGGEFVSVHNLVPIGTDPHEYEPLPADNKAATDADILFFNGLNLEGGDTGWFAKLVDSVGQDDDVIFELGKGVEPLYIESSAGEKEVNPHSFLDPQVGIIMVENARDALIEIDPDNKEIYEENANNYLDELKEVDQEYQDKIAEIPEENRILITSERAYQYMTTRYGLKEGYIWAVDTEEGGTPEQITGLVKFINENKPPILFLESNVDPRPMETVSSETGVEIFEETIFSDEIGSPGEPGDTYVKFLKYNIEKIHAGLTK